jgi:hypothetical protein
LAKFSDIPRRDGDREPTDAGDVSSGGHAVVRRAIALYTVFGFVLYHDLRIAKDGIETAEISAVFE